MMTFRRNVLLLSPASRGRELVSPRSGFKGSHWSDEDLAAAARLRARRSDDAFLFHPFDELCCLVISDAQLSLDMTDRAVPRVGHYCDGLVVQWVVAVAAEAVVFAWLEDFVLVLGVTLLAEIVADGALLLTLSVPTKSPFSLKIRIATVSGCVSGWDRYLVQLN